VAAAAVAAAVAAAEMTRSDELAERAKYLRNAAPQQFKDFCEAFAAYSRHQLGDFILATDNLRQTQGRVQQCEAILKILQGVQNG
jgi:hypothetical protein